MAPNTPYSKFSELVVQHAGANTHIHMHKLAH